jgi:hypothetical protein
MRSAPTDLKEQNGRELLGGYVELNVTPVTLDLYGMLT